MSDVPRLRARVRDWRTAGASVGLVPTMGALHEGHLSLVRRARSECERVVMSLFVNPTQFGPSEDFRQYPRDLTADVTMAEAEGCDLVFAPAVEDVYPAGYCTTVTVAGLTRELCGRSRPIHFQGVATVVTKLLNMSQPDRAYFGEKDYQQLAVIRRLVQDLDSPVQIVGCPIVREPDGLAMSSRNRFLSASERQQATAIRRGLLAAAELQQAGETAEARLTGAVRAAGVGCPDLRWDYVQLVDRETMQPVLAVDRPCLLAAAAFVGRTRLIDNIQLPVPEA